MALPVPLNHTAHTECFPVTHETTVRTGRSLLLQLVVGKKPRAGCLDIFVCVEAPLVRLDGHGHSSFSTEALMKNDPALWQLHLL